jgi:hypothetical protein
LRANGLNILVNIVASNALNGAGDVTGVGRLPVAAELLLLGVGTMIGPFLAAQAMEHFIPEGLFAFTACSHILLGLYTLFRMSRRGAPPGPAFRGVSIAKGGATPESVVLDPRSADSPNEDAAEPSAHDAVDIAPEIEAPAAEPPPVEATGFQAGTTLLPDEPAGPPDAPLESETRTEPQLPTPATDDEVAPSAPADGGTETPR